MIGEDCTENSGEWEEMVDESSDIVEGGFAVDGVGLSDEPGDVLVRGKRVPENDGTHAD